MSAATQQNAASAASLPYTCNTCLVAFHRSDAQRDHMRKDWQYVIIQNMGYRCKR